MADFWDTFEPGPVGTYESARDLAKAETVMFVRGVTRVDEGKFGPKFVAEVVLQDETGTPIDRLVSFTIGRVGSRDRVLSAMATALSEGSDPIKARLTLEGQSVIISQA